MNTDLGFEVEWEEGTWESCETCVGSGYVDVYTGEEFDPFPCDDCDGRGFVIHDCPNEDLD